jgi:hypothetical protein
MKQTTNNGQATAQKANENAQTFRFELWSTYTKKIENVKTGLTFYGISEQQATAAAVGMVIGLREKYARPQVLVFRVNPDGTETLTREQR